MQDKPTPIDGTLKLKNPVKATIGKEHYATTMTAGNHTLLADEPESIGGTDQGPSAGNFLKMSLAACTAITLRMYADRKGWPVEEITVEVDFTRQDGKTLFARRVYLSGNLDDQQRKRMLQIANACPVHKILTNPIEIETWLDF